MIKPPFAFFHMSWNVTDDYVPALRERAGLGEPHALIGTGYMIRVGRRGAAVYDGGKLIASMGPLTELVANTEHVMMAMICFWFVEMVANSPNPVLLNWDKKPFRTRAQQLAFYKAYSALVG